MGRSAVPSRASGSWCGAATRVRRTGLALGLLGALLSLGVLDPPDPGGLPGFFDGVDDGATPVELGGKPGPPPSVARPAAEAAVPPAAPLPSRGLAAAAPRSVRAPSLLPR